MKQLLTTLLCVGLWVTLIAQDIGPVTNKIFVEGVHIKASPTAPTTFGNLLIVDGLISQVGPNVKAPFDAKVIKGDSLYAYAGFIATASHIGLKAPKEERQKRPPRPGYPTNERAGITPEKPAHTQYMPNEGSITNYRKEGFTIAHTLPHGKMLPGMGAIISLNGKDFNEAVIAADNSVYAQWVSASGVFPGTLIGVMASWRELYKRAEISAEQAARYKTNRANRKRPEPLPATSAMIPVTQKKKPVYFKSEKLRDVSRALILQRELGYDLVLTEVRDGDRLANKIKKSGSSVLVSVDLPDAIKEEKADKKKDEEVDEELERLTMRKKKAISRYVNQAKILSDEGIPVSFSYLEAKPKKVHENVRRMVKEGLRSDAALAALTTGPARQLGISDIAGTLESGKMANMVLMTMPYDSADAKVKMVMVDGQTYEYEIKEKKKSAATDAVAADLSGTWTYKIEIPGMTPTGDMKITKDGDGYNIVVTNNQAPGQELTATDVVQDGNKLTFVFTVSMAGNSIALDNDLTFEGDSFEGTVVIPEFGSFEITGSKDTPE